MYKVNKMLIEPEWLNMLVDSGEPKGYVIQADQVDLATANVDTVDETESHLFYICSCVHHNSRLKKSNKMQQYADIYLLLNYSTCFGRPSRPSSGVHKTLVAACGTDRTIWEASFFKRDQIRSQIV